MAGSKARQAFLGLVFQCLATFVLISRVNGDTLCFACDKIFHPAGCGNLARCGPHEVCYTVMGTNGASSDADFTSGCMPREDCEGSIGGNLHPFHTELCSQCCHTDLCNAYLCEQKLPNGMICAKCDDVSDVDTCLKVAFCQGGEVCSSTLAPQSNTYTLGCQKKEACTGTTACCDNADLCNLNLTKTISNPRQVSVTSTPSSTTLWPSATDSETIATLESSVGVDHVTPTTVTFFSSVDNNTTSWMDSVSSLISTRGDLSTLLVTSTLGVTGSQDVTSEGSLFFSSTAGWSTSASVTMAATQVNKTIPSVVVGGESLCYSCEEMANPVFCSQFQVCGPHETCFTEKRLISNGADEFSSGCVAREECQDTELDGSRHVHETVECSECCYGDLCNDKLCKAEVLISQTALLCAVCENIPDLHACLRFKVCTVSEVCAAEQTAGGFTLGCRKTEDCTGDVVCCNDTDLCNVKGGSNVHAPSSGKTTPPTTPVSITGPPTALFLSSSFTEQTSTSSSNIDTSSSEFSTSASSSILGTQSLPVETASIAMTSPGDVTVAGTISPELSSASNGYYMTSSSLAVSAVFETTTSSLIVENLSTTTGLAFLTFSASEIPSPSTGASEIMMSATRMIDISVSSQPYNRNLSLVGSTAWPTVENFSPSSSKASQTSFPSTTAIEVSTTSTENSEISALISGIGQVTASFMRPMTVSVHSTDKSEISTPSAEGIQISSTESIEISSSSTGAKEMSASAEPYKILYSSVEPSTAQTSVENVLALTSEVSRIASTSIEVNGASSAEPSSWYLSVKQSTAQSGVESFTVSLATVSDVSTSSTGNTAIPTPSTGVMEVSMSSTEEFQILTVSTQSNDISKSSIVPSKLSASADISSLHLSVGESIAHSLVENLSVSSAKLSDINTPSTGAIEASEPSTKEIDISSTFTKFFDISTSFTVANEISVSAQPYSQHFPVQASSAPSSVETFSVSSAKASEGATHSTEAMEVPVFSTGGSKISSSSTGQIDISLYSTQTNEILVSSSLYPSAGESISQSLEEMFSGSFTKASEITTPITGVVEVSVPSTKEIEISTYLTEIKISALSTESNDISTSFTVANEVSATAEPYSLHPSVTETTVHPLVENLSVASSKSSETATTVSEAIVVSAPFSTGGSETSTPSTAGFDISTPFTQSKDILIFSSLHPSAGQSISQSLEENLSVFSTKLSDITTPSIGAIEVSVPSTKEIEISTSSTGLIEISAPATESNDISVSFTVPNEVSASVEPYRQHLSVEESTAPSTVETFSVSSAVTNEMTTPYSRAIEISSPLSIVETETSSSFIGQTDVLSSVTQAVKVSASAEFYSLYPSAEESISQSLKESFTVSSAKAIDITTPSTQAMEVSAPFSTEGSRISATSTAGIDISSSFTQTKEIFTFSSSHPFVGESIDQSAVEILSSARGSDISTPSIGGTDVSVPSTLSNDISSSFTVVNEVLASASPYRQQLSVEQSTPPSSMETFSMSSAVTSEIATPYGGASGTSSPLTAAQIVVSTGFTGQIEILASSTKTYEILASEEPYSLQSSIFEESLAHSLGENLPNSSVKASDTAMPFTEVVEASTFVSIGGSQFSTLSTGDTDLSASSQANNILASSSDANKISASSETYNWPSTAQSNVENFSVSSSESKMPTPTTRVYGASAEPYSLYLSVKQSTAQSTVENYFASLTNIDEVSTSSTGSIQVLSPSTGGVGVSVLSTKDIEISTPLTGEITISAHASHLNDISTSYTLENISADPYTLHPSVDVSIVHTLVGKLPVSATEAIELSGPFSTDGSRVSAPSTAGIDISTSFTQTTANFALSSSYPFVGESIVQSAVENLSVSSAKGSDITTTSTGAIEVSVPSIKEIEISTHLTREIKISAPSAESNDISTTFTVPSEVSASVQPYRQHLSIEESVASSSVEVFSVTSALTSETTTPYREAIEISSLLSAVKTETSSSFTGQTEILVSSAKVSETAIAFTEAIEVSAPFSTGRSETSTPSTAGFGISTPFIQTKDTVFSSLHPSQSLEENLSVFSTKTSDITTPSIGATEVSVPSTKDIEISTPSTGLMEISAPATESNDISVSSTLPNDVSASIEPYRHLSVEESTAPSSVKTFSVSSALTNEITTVYGGASLVSAPLFTVHNETLMSFMIDTSTSSTQTTEMLVSAEPYSQHFVVNGSDIPSSVKNLLVSSAIENLFATPSTEAIEVSAPLSTGGSEIATPFMERVDISSSFTQENEILVSSISQPSVGESISQSVIENLSVSSDIATPSTAWTEAFVRSSKEIEIFPSLTAEIKISAPSTESNYISWSSTLLSEFLVSAEPYTQHSSVEESTSPSSVENLSVSLATASRSVTLYNGAIENSAPFSAVNSETSASPIQTTEISNPEPDSLSVEYSTAQSSVENYSLSSAQVINSLTSTISIGVSSPPTENSAISTPSIGVIEVSVASTKESETSIPLTEETKISVPSTVANAISTSFTVVDEVFSSAEPSSKYFLVKESSEPSTMENFSVFFATASENATLSTRASADSELFPGVVDFSSPFSAVHSMMSTVSTLATDISDPSTEISESYSIQWFSRESSKQSSIEILSSAEPSRIALHYTEMNKSPASSAGPNEILASWMTAGNEISTSAEPHSLPLLIGESTAESNVSSETQTPAEVSLIVKEWDLSSASPERQTVAELSGQLTTSSVSKLLHFTQQASDSIQSVTSPEETNDRYSGQTTEPPDTSHSWSEAGLTTDLFTLLKMSAEYFYRTNRVPLFTEPSGTNPSFSQTDASPGQPRLLSSEMSPAANVTADDATTNDTAVSTDTVTQNDYNMSINTTTL